MDLKFYQGKIILHLIDLCTRLSSAAIIPNKRPETIVEYLLKIWISVYGATDKFLMDNGGEFANTNVINLGEKFGIVIKTTAAYSPWSNGTIERHNQTLAGMLDKVLADTSCDLETALAWCVNAKNSLANINGFSPYQLSIGTNPRLPSTLTDDLPALTAPITSKSLGENLQALHKAREAFIQSENSDRIRRAISHNTRTSGDTKYITGDSVYYKRETSNAWHGPGRVLGQDGQQVLLKHGGYYVRVHRCRIQLVRNCDTTKQNQSEPENAHIKQAINDISDPTARSNNVQPFTDHPVDRNRHDVDILDHSEYEITITPDESIPAAAGHSF